MELAYSKVTMVFISIHECKLCIYIYMWLCIDLKTNFSTNISKLWPIQSWTGASHNKLTIVLCTAVHFKGREVLEKLYIMYNHEKDDNYG